jgi:predicted DCC family thiol-disulfide oxidoreductase YuxK
VPHNASDHLADPDERPAADVVIYDADCGLCRSCVRVLSRVDGRRRLAYLPLQDPRVPTRYPDLRPEDLEQHVYVIDPAGRRHAGADAVKYLSRRIPALWCLAPWMHVPGTMPMWRWLYEQVAKRRRCFDRSGSR